VATKKIKKSKFTPGDFDLQVKRSVAGLGLFTYSPIKKGQCIIEYRGKVLTEKEEYESNSKYLFEVTKKKTKSSVTSTPNMKPEKKNWKTKN